MTKWYKVFTNCKNNLHEKCLREYGRDSTNLGPLKVICSCECHTEPSSNGRTADFESVYLGSNPRGSAN